LSQFSWGHIMIEVNRNEIRTNIYDKVRYPRPIRSGGSS
jgi:hypothetical protein